MPLQRRDSVVGVPANDFIYFKVVPLPERFLRGRQHQQEKSDGKNINAGETIINRDSAHLTIQDI